MVAFWAAGNLDMFFQCRSLDWLPACETVVFVYKYVILNN